jgi:hypothetical protein
MKRTLESIKRETSTLNVNLKLREMKTLTIKEAVERVHKRASLKGVVLDK